MRDLEWSECLVEPRPAPEAERRFRRETGRPDPNLRYVAGNPWVEDAVIRFSVGLDTQVALTAELSDLVKLVVSQDNSCRYCFAATRASLRILGMSEERIRNLEQNALTGELDARGQAALAFARRMSRSTPLPAPGDLEALRAAGFSELEVRELAAQVGLNLFFNRVATLFALPPQSLEALPDRWFVPILRPVVARWLRGLRRRAAPLALAPEEREGPFAQVVCGLDGLPLARSLRAVIDGMWRSETLPRRGKALVFAVVGRALGCPLSESEGARLALAEGLAPAELDEALAHLAAPSLEPVEVLSLGFARETVWYQPAPIQRRAREVQQQLGRDRFIELTAVAALANMLCRLGVVLERVR